MFFYSPLLSFIVIAAFPFYIGISAGATPVLLSLPANTNTQHSFRTGTETRPLTPL